MQKLWNKVIAVFCILSLIIGIAANQGIPTLIFNVGAVENEVELYTYLKEGLMEGLTKIDLEKYQTSLDVVKTVYDDLVQNEVDLMNVDTSFKYNYQTMQDGRETILAIEPAYIKVDNLEEKRKEIHNVIDSIIASTDDRMTDVEKALYVHDYIILNTIYGPDNEGLFEKSYYTAYGALIGQRAVCQGYSRAYAYILNQMGIETTFVISETMGHMWNMVKIDGKYYHVDVTYDDPTFENVDRFGRVSHNHFMVSDKTMENKLNHYAWEGPVAEEDESRVATWADINSPMQYLDGKWYYAKYIPNANIKDSATKICEYDMDSNSEKEIASLNILWPADKGNQYYAATYTSVIIAEGKLYYNTPTEIHRLDIATNQNEMVVRIQPKNGYIFGMALQDKELVYHVAASPNEAGQKIESGVMKNGVGIIEDEEVTTLAQNTSTEQSTQNTENASNQISNYFKITNTKIKKVQKYKKKKKIKITVAKAKGMSGYEVQYATNKKFKKAKIKSFQKTKYTMKKLKKKKYYIRVRSYVESGGKKYYGRWSEAKIVKMK